MKRREAPGGEDVHLGPVVQEELHDGQAVLAGSVVQGGDLELRGEMREIKSKQIIPTHYRSLDFPTNSFSN